MRVAVLPTGKMEWHALPQAFRTLFPNHDFYSLPTQREVDEFGEEFPCCSFTSCDVTTLVSENNADKLLERAAAAAIGNGKMQPPADLVLMLDDLELQNSDQPAAVVQVMREAALRFLAKKQGPGRTRFETVLKKRVSFHLAKPMIESWLLADPTALKTAGLPQSRLPSLPASLDPECFDIQDSTYLSDDGSSCSSWQALQITRKKKDHMPLWLKKGSPRQLHPKHYLSWLWKDPTNKSCSAYDETSTGVAALKAFNWAALLGKNSQHARFARALIADVALALSEPNPFQGGTAAETFPVPSSPELVLRNL